MDQGSHSESVQTVSRAGYTIESGVFSGFECDAVTPRLAGLGARADALGGVVVLRIHLDDCGSDNGPLRVISGSRRSGVLNDDAVLEYVKTRESGDCLARDGVLLMRPLLIHASSKVTINRPRRVLHIECADSLDLGPGTQLAIL